MALPSSPATYALLLRLDRRRRLKIGRFGTFSFKRGWYVYVGGAFGGGGKRRTDRHVRRLGKNQDGSIKTAKWQIDYFREAAEIEEIWYASAYRHLEHDWACAIERMDGAEVPVPLFGASDCIGMTGCAAHFFYFAEPPTTAAFRAARA